MSDSQRAPGAYRGQHQAADVDSGAPLYDITKNNIYPADFYAGYAFQYGGDGEPIARVLGFHRRPNARVIVYRAVPKSTRARIEIGDWVTITRSYATEHGRSNLCNDYRITRKTVHARDLFTEGNSLHEWGYVPQPRVPTRRDLLLVDAARGDQAAAAELARIKVKQDAAMDRFRARWGLPPPPAKGPSSSPGAGRKRRS